MGVDNNLGLLGGLVRGGDTGEILNLAGAGLLVQTLGVTLLGNLDGDIDINLDKGQGLVTGLTAVGVEVTGDLTVRPVGGDEAGDGDGAAVGKELGDLGDTADVLVAVLLAEAEVLVQAEAHIVAIQTVGRQAQVQQVLLEGGGDGGLSGGGQTGEPDGEALLFTEALAFGTGEGWVPGDVAVEKRVKW